MSRKHGPNVTKAADDPMPNVSCTPFVMRKVTPSHVRKNALYHHWAERCSLTSTIISNCTTIASLRSSLASSIPRKTTVLRIEPNKIHPNFMMPPNCIHGGLCQCYTVLPLVKNLLAQGVNDGIRH